MLDRCMFFYFYFDFFKEISHCRYLPIYWLLWSSLPSFEDWMGCIWVYLWCFYWQGTAVFFYLIDLELTLLCNTKSCSIVCFTLCSPMSLAVQNRNVRLGLQKVPGSVSQRGSQWIECRCSNLHILEIVRSIYFFSECRYNDG